MQSTEFVPLTEEQHAIVNLSREFGAAEIRPAVSAVDDADTDTPWELWRKAAKAGIASFMLPRQYGGGGFTDVYTQCLVREELSAADSPLADLLTSGGFFADPLLELGTDAQKERWLRPLTTDDPPMTALAVTEPDLGSGSAAITTKARRVGSGYKLTGAKTWISNGGVADFYMLFATIDSERRARGVTAFLIEKGASGLTFGEPQRTAGQCAIVTTEVFLEDVFVPDDQRLGEEGQGFEGLTRTFDISRTMLGASAIGLARACVDLATAYADERAGLGKQITEQQAAQLAEMTTRIEASRLLTWRSAKLLDNHDDANAASVAAKQHACQTAMFCSQVALQTLGGNGHAHEFLAQKWTRDAKLHEIENGTLDMHLTTMGGSLR